MSFLASLHARAASQPRRIVFAEAFDPRVREAVQALQSRGIVHPVLVGEAKDAVRGVEHIDVADPTFSADVAAAIFQARSSKGMTEAEAAKQARSPLLAANAMVRLGRADGCVAGCVATTADVVRAALWLIGVAPGTKTLSSAFYMDVPAFRSADGEVLTFTDCAIVKKPSAEQLADIALAAAADRRRIVGDEPRVAFLSFSTYGSARGESIDRIRAALALVRSKVPELAVDGELQGDAALIGAVSARKSPDSPVGGRANVLVFPDLDSGNIAYKLVQRLASASAIGPILQGMRHPCNDLSRGASAEDIFNVAAVTALQAGDHAATLLNGFRQETDT
ncbi:MAG: phosphate acetyltransferase [Gemmatimonadota bacterium]